METKICAGKHGCGRDLPIDQFYISKRLKNGNVVYTTVCKKCGLKRKKQWMKENPERTKEYRSSSWYKKSVDKYKQSDKYKAKVKREYINLAPKHRAKNTQRMRDKCNNLTDSYITQILRQQGMFDPSPEIIKVKRVQLLLHREIKKIKNEQQRHVNN